MNSLATIPYGKFKRMCDSLEKTLGGKNSENVPISYEFIVRSFFPDVYTNIAKANDNLVMKKYIEGYNEGYKDCSDGKKAKNHKGKKK